jgi:hypothetical protein
MKTNRNETSKKQSLLKTIVDRKIAKGMCQAKCCQKLHN